MGHRKMRSFASQPAFYPYVSSFRPTAPKECPALPNNLERDDARDFKQKTKTLAFP
jgi:hypothetical protein